MLPLVSREVAGQVSHMMSDTGKITDSWMGMAESNMVLFERLTDIATVAAASDKERGEMFLRGAMYVWEALRVQDEVDDMNNQWGL